MRCILKEYCILKFIHFTSALTLDIYSMFLLSKYFKQDYTPLDRCIYDMTRAAFTRQDKTDKTRQDKTRQDKTRHYHTLCSGFHYEIYISISPYRTLAVV